MLPLIGAIISTIGSAAGAAASGVASLATSVLSGAAGVVGGAASAVGGLFGKPQMTSAEAFAAMAEPGYYDTAGGILGGVTRAATGTIDYLGNIAPKAAALYTLVSPPKQAETQKPTTGLPTLASVNIPSAQLPIFAQTPAIMTTGAQAPAEQPNYLIYIAIGIILLLVMRKK